MNFEVTNNSNGESFSAECDETILDAALKAGKVFPYSCRSGTCGSCIATLVSGSIEYAGDGAQALSDVDKSQGKILLCQARARENTVIEATEISGAQAIEIKTLPCRISAMTKLSHDVMELQLKLPQNQQLNFVAGQYIDILLRDGRRRSFSLANQPNADDTLQLHVREVPGGRFTGRIFNSVRVRDLLRFEGPFGTFFLRTDSNLPVILMAGGTGFAPIKSILEQAFANNIERPLHLFWGVRTDQDLYLHALASQWAQSFANFRYTPVLSEQSNNGGADCQWQGEIGWVHDCVVKHYADLSHYECYASGPPPMIDAAKPLFEAHGLSSDHFYYDSFEFNNDSLVADINS